MLRFTTTLFAFAGLCTISWAQSQPTAPLDTKDAPDWYSVFTLPDAAGLYMDNVAETRFNQALGLENTYQSFKLFSGNRLTVNLDFITRPEQESGSTIDPREEAAAQAYFQISPSWTVGGRLILGTDEFENTNILDDKKLQTGIKLESAFKF